MFNYNLFFKRRKYVVFKILIIILLTGTTFLGANSRPKTAKNGMVVSVSTIASQVGVNILRKGGNAVDAAVAVGFALAVTYPYAGNIGGGGFMVLHLKNGKNTTIDFREKAPFLASKNMYLDRFGNYNPKLSREGTTSAGVPGSVAGLIFALQKYGTMSLAEVIEPAIKLAQNGWKINSLTAEKFENYLPTFKKYPATFDKFTKYGKPYLEGDVFKQPDLARTLELIKEKGSDGFYKGKIAKLLIETIKSMGGYITQADLDKYTPVERKPIIGSYRGYKIVSMPPPSSGGIALVELLNILENFKFNTNDWGSSKYIHRIVEAMKYVFADRTSYLGDSDFYPVPEQGLISKKYAKTIFNKIGDKAVPADKITAGKPMDYKESTETTHYSVYDKNGNAVSVTTTLNSAFGSKIVVDGAGFLLNNEMDDFSAKPGTPNQFGLRGSEANSIQPGKRMLSSMTPTIVLKDDLPYLVIGSPGGSTIITVVLQVIMNSIDFNMNIQEAIDAPRIHNQWLPDLIFYEKYAIVNDVKENLIKMGYKFADMHSKFRILGIAEGIMIDNTKHIIYGASDPRGDGTPVGY